VFYVFLQLEDVFSAHSTTVESSREIGPPRDRAGGDLGDVCAHTLVPREGFEPSVPALNGNRLRSLPRAGYAPLPHHPLNPAEAAFPACHLAREGRRGSPEPPESNERIWFHHSLE